MKALKYIIFGLIGIIVLAMILGSIMSDDMYVEREAVIEAPVEVVYAHIATPKLRTQWDPWLAIDPEAEVTYEGPESGVGAINTWSSKNEDLGVGKQEIMEVRENEYIRTKVTMEMMEGGIDSEFELAATEEGTQTKVVWKMNATSTGYGPFNGLMARMGEVFVGMSFEQGLASIGTMMEEVNFDEFMKKDMGGIEVKEMPEFFFLGIQCQSTVEKEAISQKLTESYGKIAQYIGANQLEFSGAPITIAQKWEPENNNYEFIAGIPITSEIEVDQDGIKSMKREAGLMATMMHIGSYDGMESTYNALMAYIEGNGYQIIGSPMEQYISDPGETPEEELMTLVAFPVTK